LNLSIDFNKFDSPRTDRAFSGRLRFASKIRTPEDHSSPESPWPPHARCESASSCLGNRNAGCPAWDR